MNFLFALREEFCAVSISINDICAPNGTEEGRGKRLKEMAGDEKDSSAINAPRLFLLRPPGGKSRHKLARETLNKREERQNIVPMSVN